MQSTSKLATIVCVAAVAATLAVPAPSAGSQNRQAHRGDPSVRLSMSGAVSGAMSGAVPGVDRRAAPVLRVEMDGVGPGENRPLRRFTNTGSASLRVTVVHRADGRAIRVPGRYDGWAARLPAYDDGAAPPRAAIRVENRGPTADPMSPGIRSFRFGAEFRLDGRSDGSRVDNGNNLVQRGHYGSRRQYKLQVDHRVVSCRVKGSAGTLLVRSSRITPQAWYRVRCRRSDRQVVLKLWRLAADGPVMVSSVTRRGRTGSVTMTRTTPLSVGGKLTSRGRIPAAGNDQFNGVVDRVLYDVRR